MGGYRSDLISGLLHWSTLVILRWAWRRQLGSREHSVPDQDSRNVLIVGAGVVGEQIASYLSEHPELGRSVYGILDNRRPIGRGVIGRISDLARLSRTGFVDEVILAAPRGQDRGLMLQLLREARRLRLDVRMVPDTFGCAPASATGGGGLSSAAQPAAKIAAVKIAAVKNRFGRGRIIWTFSCGAPGPNPARE